MSHTFSNLLAHVIFSTKDREPLITPEIEPRLHAYIGSVMRDKGGTLLAIGGMPDHIHWLMASPPRIAPADLIGSAKSNSSRWARETFGMPFAWQNGYGIFSVSESAAADVKAYIANQREHHRRTTFQEEYVAVLERNRISYDPDTIWDGSERRP